MTRRAFALWYASSTVLIIAAVSYLEHAPPWTLPSSILIPLACLVSAYVAAGVVTGIRQANAGASGLVAELQSTTLLFGLAFFLLLVLGRSLSRFVILTVFAGGLLGASVPLLVAESVAPLLSGLALLLAAGFTWVTARAAKPAGGTPPAITRRLWPTNKVVVRGVFFPDQLGPRFNDPNRGGGGVSPFGDRELVAAWDGTLFVAHRVGDKLDVKQLRARIPINVAEAAVEIAKEPNLGEGFRVQGMHVQELGHDSIRVLSVHDFWKVDSNCFVERLSVVEGPTEQVLAGTGPQWRTLFDTKPCLHIRAPNLLGHTSLLEGGGRIAMLDAHTALVTIGDHEYDGVNQRDAFAQDLNSTYGKSITIDVNTGASAIFTSGNRNPQGLVIRADGTIWDTEHGPRGGDELNRLERGGNYGWPVETYGTNYYTLYWPRIDSAHADRYKRPAYSWVPSIGPSNLIEVHGDKFKAWNGDLLLGSLRAQTLFRIHTDGDRVAFAEPIDVGHRIRDLAMTSTGDVVLWLNEGKLAFLEPATPDGQGDYAFVAQCLSCHSIGDWSGTGDGPDLHNIYTRPVASLPGFKYSDALRRVGGRWTSARLNAFLASPAAFAPGTRMDLAGVKDSATRAAIVAYLQAAQR